MATLSQNRVGVPKHDDFCSAATHIARLGSKSFRQTTSFPANHRRPARSLQNLLITRASAALSSNELATYRLPHHSTVGHSSAEWFQAAVTEVVKHLENAPFLQLVRFANASDPLAAFKEPKFSSFSVPESVVAVPELWSSIAESVESDSADVVILVQRVDPHGTGAIDVTSGTASTQPVDDSLKAHVEEACQKLVATGIGESILQGKVGECCEHQQPSSSSSTPSSSISTTTAGIVPFSSSHRSPSTSMSSTAAPVRGASVKVKALGSSSETGGTSSSAPLSGYWGVVVQSKHHTGAEGCYLLRAVRQVCPPVASEDLHGCSCTHYSLTKVCKGEHMERQFIESWLV
jgi:hypothetical protein